MSFKAVLFDLDGTLLDTIEDLTDSMNLALEQLGCPPRSVDECKLFVGEGREIFAARALSENSRDEATVARCADLLSEDYAGRWTAKTKPYEGIMELLAGLQSRGLVLVVFSNKPDEFTGQMVGHFFPDVEFKIVLGARPDAPLKPDPTIALQIAAKLDIPPAEFLYIGDTCTDMQTAGAAGMHAVGVTWGFRPPEELTANGAKTLIDDPLELLRLL